LTFLSRGYQKEEYSSKKFEIPPRKIGKNLFPLKCVTPKERGAPQKTRGIYTPRGGI